MIVNPTAVYQMSAMCAERCGVMKLLDKRFQGEARGEDCCCFDGEDDDDVYAFDLRVCF